MSSVGSGSSTVVQYSLEPVEVEYWCSNSDFMSKDTSLWSSGICIVLMPSIKFSVDCSLCLDS